MGAGGGQGSTGPVTPHMNSYRSSAVPASAAATAAVFLSGKMGVLLSSLWLGVTVSVIFLVKFIAARVLRIRAGRGAVGEEGRADPPKEEFPSISAEGSFFFQQIFQDDDREWREEVQVARNVEDDEPSSLAFKFGGQGLDDKSTKDYNEVLETSQLLDDPVRANTRDNTKATTNVNNYRFMSEKGFVGFIQMPESKTFSIHESYVEGGLKDTFSVHPNQDARPRVPDLLDRELKDGFSSAKGFDQQVQHSLDKEEVVLSESKTSTTHGSSVASHKYEDAQNNDTESLDRELQDRFSSVKRFDQQNQHSSDDEQVVRPASKTFSTHQSHVDGYQNEDAQPYDLDAMDRDLKDRLSSVKPLDRQHQHISDDEQMVPPGSQTFSTHQSHVDGHQYEDAQPYVMDRDIKGRFSSVKDLDQRIHHRSDDDDEEESVGSNQEVKSGDEDGVREPMDENGVREPMRQAEVLIEERREAIGGDGTQATPMKSESSEAFDLESMSFSSSDGYSVKDITAEYDSDDLISDSESSFGGSEDSDLEIEFQGSGKELDDLLVSDQQNTLREKSMDLDAGFKDELPSDGGGGGDDGEDKNDKASVDFADHFDQQLDERFVLESHEEVEKLVEEVTNRAAAITEKIRLEHMEFEKEYTNNGSMDFDEEFIDLGSEKVSFLMNQSRSLSSSEHVISDKSIIQPVEKGEAKAEPEKEDSHVKGCDFPEETDLKNEDLSKEEDDDLESLWEHQELIEQLKLDLKKAKSIGLPTIQEESDNFKLMEDLKPWKIDVELLHKDPMDELNQLYQSYKERMRKFDILNYQKMYSIGCLKLKDPLTSIGMHKTVSASIFSENFRACRRRKSENDPSQTFIKELRSDLENVYVGQMCLSWEFLWWQYEKAQELFESDHYNSQRYNQVAGEFQQLLVIMQRFLEDEPFQGPRLTYYVKNRCVNRGLLQVPMIREDSAKDYKSEATSHESLAVTSENLKYTMMTTIRLFGKFVKSDKDVEAPSVMKGLGLIKTHVELQDPSDSELLENIRDSLQKKEKKLNDLLKVGNCLVKKFKKPQEGRLSKDMFYSQVDMKLISRALTMPRISSEQLLWCHKKLSKINFVNRMLHREPAFLLFPC